MLVNFPACFCLALLAPFLFPFFSRLPSVTYVWFGGLTEIGPHLVLWWDRTPAGLSWGTLHPIWVQLPQSPPAPSALPSLPITPQQQWTPTPLRTSPSNRRRTKRPIWAISSKERTDRLHTGHTFQTQQRDTVGENGWKANIVDLCWLQTAVRWQRLPRQLGSCITHSNTRERA